MVLSIIQKISIICWFLVTVYWLAQISTQKNPAKKFSLKLHLVSRAIFTVSFIFLFLPNLPILSHKVMIIFPAIVILSVLFSISGLVLCIFARRDLASNWSPTLDFKENHELITGGAYKITRHPIYTGFLAMFLGTALAFGTLGGFLGFIIFFLDCFFRTLNEEKLLSDNFPQYRQYTQKTKKLIPFIF